MTLVLIDGLEDLSSWATSVIQIQPGRNGNGYQPTWSQTADFTIPSAQESATVTMGFAFRVTTSLGSAFNIITRLMSDGGATDHLDLGWNSDGSWAVQRAGTVLGTSAQSLLVLNTWYYIEIQATLNDTTGTVVVRSNGTTIINLSGVDTKNAGIKTTFDLIRLTISTNITGSITFDDLYIMAGVGDSFVGDCAVETLYPNGGGIGGINYGNEQRPTVGTGVTNTDNSINIEIGTRWTATRAGRITKIRYYRSATMTATVNLNVWDGSGTRVAGPIADSQGAGTAGYQTVTLPTPVTVSAGGTFTVSLGATTVSFRSSTETTVNTTDLTAVNTTLSAATAGQYPNSSNTAAVYIEPIYQPGPTANVWIGSDGDDVNNYLLVNENPASAAQYVGDNVPGHQDLYTMTDLVRTVGTIVGVCHSSYSAKSDVGTKQIRLVNHRVYDTKSAPISLGPSYIGAHYVLTGDPEAAVEQRITVAGAPPTGNFGFDTCGVRVQFTRAGKVTKIRYATNASAAGTLDIQVYTSAGVLVYNQPATNGAGVWTIILPTPIVVAAGDTFTFAHSTSGQNPANLGTLSVANTTDCTFINYYKGGNVNTFPNTVDVSHTFYIEPVFVAAADFGPWTFANVNALQSGVEVV